MPQTQTLECKDLCKAVSLMRCMSDAVFGQLSLDPAYKGLGTLSGS